MNSSIIAGGDDTKASHYNNLRYDAVYEGMVIIFPVITPPTGWLLCDGTLVSRVTYANLFAVIGESFGAGDGLTTFGLPDLRGKTPICKDAGTVIGTVNTGNVTISEAQMPTHAHIVTGQIHHHRMCNYHVTYSGPSGTYYVSELHNASSIEIDSSSAGAHDHGGVTQNFVGIGTPITMISKYRTLYWIIKF